MVQRYFVTETLVLNEAAKLSEEDYHHLVHVMRHKVGQKIECVSLATESAFLCEISLIDPDLKQVQVTPINELNMRVELPVEIVIACGFSKRDKMEWIVQKGTELGAHRFIFFQSRYSVVKLVEKKQADKTARLQKIAQEAAEQAHRTHIPTVTIETFDQLLMEEKAIGVVAFEESAKVGEQNTLVRSFDQLAAKDKLICVFGPEGGLHPEEVNRLNAVNYFSAGLGPRIMRAETAPMYVLAAASYHFELQA